MKKFLFILSILSLSFFSCKKEKVRKGIEGIWNIESWSCNCGNPNKLSGTYEFTSCPKKDQTESNCQLYMDETTITPFADTFYRKSTSEYSIGKRGKFISIDRRGWEILKLNDNELKIHYSSGSNEYVTMEFSR